RFPRMRAMYCWVVSCIFFPHRTIEEAKSMLELGPGGPASALGGKCRGMATTSPRVLLFSLAMENLRVNERQDQRLTLSPWVYVIAAMYFAAHMVTATHYGYFRDALYYLACSEHPAWGYVDQPPLIVGLVWLVRHTLGTSLPALLLLTALAGAGRIVLTAL